MINFKDNLEKGQKPERYREELPRMRRGYKLVTYLIILAIIGFLIFSSNLLISSVDGDGMSFFSQLRHLTLSSDKTLDGEKSDQVNILLLGMGGKNHEGGYLTDTIMLVTIKPSTSELSILSIPRDLTIPMESGGWRKINNINAYAEVDKKGSGGKAISEALGYVLDMEINYYIRADFDGFVNVINELGGITVDVENKLEDYKYPIKGREDNENYLSRFEHLYIEEGIQKMDGELALKYARSRHALGIEGSDFARSRRQQKILQAVKDKVLNKNILLKPMTISKVLRELKDHVSTNLRIWEMIKLWDSVKTIDQDSIINNVLDDGPRGLLVAGRSSAGAYILTPKSGNYKDIARFVSGVFSPDTVTLQPAVISEGTSLEIINGTFITGWAGQIAEDLERYNFNVIRIGNSPERDYTQSVIFDLTYGEKNNSLEMLQERTEAKVESTLPNWLIERIQKETQNGTTMERPDFIIILGRNNEY